MPPAFHRVRHLNRYREIVLVFARHGFGELISHLGLFDNTNLRRRDVPIDDEEVPPSPLTAPMRFRQALDELGPTFVKVGQILSTRPDIVPPAFVAELEHLQDDARPLPWEAIRPVIEAELETDLYSVFRFVESRPLAAASLAQVHRARLLDGSDVVIKVQRPAIERQIEIDLEILMDVARLIQAVAPLNQHYNLPAIVDDFAYTLRMELDYRLEGQHADFFRENFANDNDVYIPTIYWQHSTQRLLVMERLRGIKIDDAERIENAGYDCHDIAMKAARLIVKEVLEDGFFHADPHPGNLLVMQGGVIGVMDFGMVGWLDTRLRLQLAQLYIVTVKRDVDGMVDRLIQLGVADYDVDRPILRRDLTRLVRKYYGRPLSEIRIRELLGDIMPIIYQHHLQMPTDLWLLLKTLAIMEGVGLRLDPDFDMFEASRPLVRRLARRLRSPLTLRESALRVSASFSDFMLNAPETGMTLLRRMEEGQFKILFQPVGFDKIMDRIDQIANRISVSILLAALVLGLSLLLPRLDDAPFWFSAFFGGMFITVTLLSLWLAVSIIRRNR